MSKKIDIFMNGELQITYETFDRCKDALKFFLKNRGVSDERRDFDKATGWNPKFKARFNKTI